MKKEFTTRSNNQVSDSNTCNRTGNTPEDQPSATFAQGEEEVLIAQYLKHMVQPSTAQNLTLSHYTEHGWPRWDLPKNTTRHWTQPLGKDLCIFDFDSRKFDSPGELWHNDSMSWNDPEHVHGLSLGILNHWLYGTSSHPPFDTPL